jgi:thioesterase domain-containing protein
MNFDRAALDALEVTLRREIPLTRAMGVTVAGFDTTGLTLHAPLAPNLNHKHTAFGGSLATLATLAGWGLLQLLLREHAPVTVVIQESTARYLRPVTAELQARCALPPADALDRFVRTLERKGAARIGLDVEIPSGNELAVSFHGQFVAFDPSRDRRAAPHTTGKQ